jgi:hypothetical protein
LDLAAHFKRLGHEIEFRPPLPNGKKADFVVASDTSVYFEIKRLQKPERRLAVEELVNRITFALSDLTTRWDNHAVKGPTIEVDLNQTVTERLNRRGDREVVAKEVIETVVEVVRRELAIGTRNEFVIPSIGKIKIGTGISSVSYRLPADESRRILRTLKEAAQQLHPDYPGIVVLESGQVLQTEDVQKIGTVLEQSIPEHLVAALVVPEYFGMFEPFSPFYPFYVLNRKGRYDVRTLKVFSDLLAAYSRPSK